MRESDYAPFCAMLDQVATLLSKGAHKPDPQASALWFRTLAAYELDAVRRAFDAHVRDPDRGRFVPVPADIIAKIHALDSRPSADEAWAIAVRGADEHVTVTWTNEIAEAWGACKPVWDIGDKVAARMAFKDSYARIVADAKRGGMRAEWFPSLGHDAAGRLPEVERAVTAGLIGHEAALKLAAPLSIEQMPSRVRERLLELRAKLVSATVEKQEASPAIPDPDNGGVRGDSLLNLGIVGAMRRQRQNA